MSRVRIPDGVNFYPLKTPNLFLISENIVQIKVLIPKIDKEVQRLPSGFENEQICIENFEVASDRIRIEASGSDGVSYE